MSSNDNKGVAVDDRAALDADIEAMPASHISDQAPASNPIAENFSACSDRELEDVIEPMPDFAGGDILHLQEVIRDDGTVAPRVRGSFLSTVRAVREKAAGLYDKVQVDGFIAKSIPPSTMSPENQAAIAELIHRHLEKFPKEPTEGFDSVDDYMEYDEHMNIILSEERGLYNQHSIAFHPEDPEMPGKKMCSVLFSCADGRICPTNFMEEENLISRFATRWLPAAGLILVPEIPKGNSSKGIDKLFQSDPSMKEMVFNRFDNSLAAKVTNFLKKKESSDGFSRLHFEYQSHYQEEGFPCHGCGAHGSDFDKAQAETIKDAILVDMWLADRYPEQYAAGWFRVYRTTHDTGPGGNIMSASHLDKKRVSTKYYEEHREMFEEAEQRFSSPVIKDNPEGVLKKHQANYMGIDEEKHGEQAIRIGDTHFAHTLLGQSVLEISWTNSPEILYTHITILLGIIERNFRQNGANSKPAIIHFDLLKDRTDIVDVFLKVMQKIESNPELNSRLSDGTLKIVATETNPHDYRSQRVNPKAPVSL